MSEQSTTHPEIIESLTPQATFLDEKTGIQYHKYHAPLIEVLQNVPDVQLLPLERMVQKRVAALREHGMNSNHSEYGFWWEGRLITNDVLAIEPRDNRVKLLANADMFAPDAITRLRGCGLRLGETSWDSQEAYLDLDGYEFSLTHPGFRKTMQYKAFVKPGCRENPLRSFLSEKTLDEYASVLLSMFKRKPESIECFMPGFGFENLGINARGPFALACAVTLNPGRGDISYDDNPARTTGYVITQSQAS